VALPLAVLILFRCFHAPGVVPPLEAALNFAQAVPPPHRFLRAGKTAKSPVFLVFDPRGWISQ